MESIFLFVTSLALTFRKIAHPSISFYFLRIRLFSYLVSISKQFSRAEFFSLRMVLLYFINRNRCLTFTFACLLLILIKQCQVIQIFCCIYKENIAYINRLSSNQVITQHRYSHAVSRQHINELIISSFLHYNSPFILQKLELTHWKPR